MKRVVAFSDIFDEVPANAKYLFSRRADIFETFKQPKENLILETEGGIVSVAPPSDIYKVETAPLLYMHYYEVDSMDFEELVEAGFLKKTGSEKMKEFMHKYKLSAK